MSTTTFTIPYPWPCYQRHRSLTPDEQKTNAQTAELGRAALLELIKASATTKGWSLEWQKGQYGDHQLLLNGMHIPMKWAEKWIAMDNGGDVKRGTKISTQIYYNKPLTVKDHGTKIVAVIQSILDRKEKQDLKSKNQDNNAHLSAHAMKYMAIRHGLIVTVERGDGHSPSSSDSDISSTFRMGHNDCVFRFSTREADFGKMTMTLGQNSILNDYRGTYPLGGLSTKMVELVAIVNEFEKEFAKIAKIWPEAVAYVKEHGEYKD